MKGFYRPTINHWRMVASYQLKIRILGFIIASAINKVFIETMSYFGFAQFVFRICLVYAD